MDTTHVPAQVPVHQAVAAIIGELGGVPKGGHNNDQNYDFRGIDDVLKALHPLLAKHGVVIAPQVTERQYEEHTSKSGTAGHVAHLRVEFTVYGPMGDTLRVSTWGEGLDYSDKAAQKAMTAAYKYALMQLFAVCDPLSDADRNTDEAGSTAPAAVSVDQAREIREAATAAGLSPSAARAMLKAAAGVDVADLVPADKYGTALAAFTSLAPVKRNGNGQPA